MTSLTASAIYITNGTKLMLSTFQGRLIQGMMQQSFGAIRVENKAILVGVNLTFQGNQALQKGGVISIGQQGMVNLTNSTFFNNSAMDKGGCIYLTGDSSISCNQCTFQSNQASQSSVLYASNNEELSLAVNFTNSQFFSNSHGDSLMTLLYTNASISNSTFIDNIAQTVNHGITLIASNLTASNITINYQDPNFLSQLQWPVDTGFFSLNYRSFLLINKGSNIQNCMGAAASVVWAAGQSSVIIEGQSSISNCVSQEGGSTVFLQMTRYARIRNSYFLNNGDIDVTIEKAYLNVSNSIFTQSNSQSIFASRSNLTVYNTSFNTGSNSYINGKGVYCKCQSMNITNCTFQNLQGLEGGAVYLTSSSPQSNFQISNSSFVNNVAMYGGAIKVQDAMTVTLATNTFLNNQALVITPPNMYSSRFTQKANGGALNLDCNNGPMGLFQNCQVNIQQQNNFSLNSAQNDGGAVSYQANLYYDDGTNIYSNNQAAYGGNAASYPQSLLVDFIANNDYVNPVSNSPVLGSRLLQASNSTNQTFPDIISGTSFAFLVYILDNNGQVYNTDSSSIATLTTEDPSVQITGNQVIAQSGVYNFSNVLIVITPGTSASFTLNITGLQTYGNPVPFLQQAPISISIGSRTCVQGESYTSDGRCAYCSSTSYSYQAPTMPSTCAACPDNAICFGLNYLAPVAGYWRSDNESLEILPCPNPNACLGGSTPEELIGVCAPGYTGILCGNCANGYRKSSPFECTTCPSSSLNAIYLLILFFLSIALIVILVSATQTYDSKVSSNYLVYLKIIVNHFQVLGIIMSLQYFWPAQLQSLQSAYAYFSGVSQSIFSYDCFLQMGGIQTEDKSSKIFITKIVFFALVPLIISGGVALIWGIMGYIRKSHQDFKVKTISTTLVILYLIHPSIANIYFNAFNCITVGNETRLRDDISTVCYSGNHMILVVVVALPAIIVWLIAAPIYALSVLISKKATIFQMHQASQLSKSDQHQIKELRLRFGFLFIGYQTKIFFWEIIVIYRKLLLVMLTVLLTNLSPQAQVLAGFLLLIVSMVLHVKFQPYNSQALNTMEHYSIQVISLTMYAGMFYVTGVDYTYMNGNGVKWLFFLLIVISNVAFLLYWIRQMRIEVLKIAVHKGKRVFRILTCGQVDIKAFQERYMSGKDDDEGMQVNPTTTKRPPDNRENEGDAPAQEMQDFDDIRAKGKKAAITLGMPRWDDGNQGVESSDSDFRKSQDVERASGPDFESDRANSKHNGRINPDQVKLDFPIQMMKVLKGPFDDDINTNEYRTHTNSRLIADSNEGGRTQREQLASYRKIFPEHILSHRGMPEDNDMQASKTDRTKYGTINTNRRFNQQDEDAYTTNSRLQRRQQYEVPQDDSNSSRLSSESDIRKSQMNLVGRGGSDGTPDKILNKRPQLHNIHKADEVDHSDVGIAVSGRRNPQSNKLQAKEQSHSSSRSSVREYNDDDSSDQKDDDFERGSIDQRRNNFMQETFKFDKQRGFEMTMNRRTSPQVENDQELELSQDEDGVESEEIKEDQLGRRARRRNFI